jgi:hypothetical protein
MTVKQEQAKVESDQKSERGGVAKLYIINTSARLELFGSAHFQSTFVFSSPMFSSNHSVDRESFDKVTIGFN